MKKPCVFISSTCYDLRQVRADMKQFIEGLGLDPVLSEFNSFPVDPNKSTVENCLRVVENKADIFVLIVGGRYGSITDCGKSVTNLEFLGARAKGIPIYVFVIRLVLDLLPFWKANPTADFSHAMDSPLLFHFVEQLKAGGDTWFFPFDLAEEICSVLRAQFAYLFMDSLELRRRASLSDALSPKFRHLRGILLRLIIERPDFWEYSLFSEALEEELKSCSDLKRDWRYSVAMGPGASMTSIEFCRWAPSKASEIQRAIANAVVIVNEALPIAFGPAGVSGDPEAILYAANRLAAIYRSFLEWKLDFRRIALSEEAGKLRALDEKICDNMMGEVEEFSRTLTSAMQAVRSGQTRNIKVTLSLTVPDQSEFLQELERIVISSSALN